jgi:ribosomal protein S18 acetylase RimI-like enzyme
VTEQKAVLRQASSKEIPILLGFIKSYYKLESIVFFEDKVYKALIELINSNNIGRVWLIYLNNKAIGYIVLCFSYSLVSFGQDGMIDEFYIDDEYRKKGISTQILNIVMKNSKKLGLNCLYLEISKNNIAAQTLYEKLNFKVRDNYFLMKLDL